MILNHKFSLKQYISHKTLIQKEGTIIGLSNFGTINSGPTAIDEADQPWYIVSWWDSISMRTHISAVSEQDIIPFKQ